MEDENKKSPAEIEKAKTAKQRAEDISYTLNHTVVCSATDVLGADPYINTFILKKLGHKSKLSHSWASEIIGDVGAIPFTIGMQRFFPGVMSGLSKMAEPVFQKAFRKGAERDAKEWAKQHGHKADSPEYKARVEKIYQYEMTHLPQALMWTGSSLLLNVGAQKAIAPKMPTHHLVAGKIGGTLVTAAITVGGRMLFPRKAEKLDHFTSEKILLPIEKKINKILDIDEESQHHHHHKHKHTEKDNNWQKRIKMDKEDKISSLNI